MKNLIALLAVLTLCGCSENAKTTRARIEAIEQQQAVLEREHREFLGRLEWCEKMSHDLSLGMRDAVRAGSITTTNTRKIWECVKLLDERLDQAETVIRARGQSQPPLRQR